MEFAAVRQTIINTHLDIYHNLSLSKNPKEALLGRLLKEIYPCIEEANFQFASSDDLKASDYIQALTTIATEVTSHALWLVKDDALPLELVARYAAKIYEHTLLGALKRHQRMDELARSDLTNDDLQRLLKELEAKRNDANRPPKTTP